MYIPQHTQTQMMGHTNLYVEFQVFIHGKYMFKNVLRYPRNDSHPLGIMKVSLKEERAQTRACYWSAG